MLAAFGVRNPSPERMMATFFDRFPYYYMHSLSCFVKLFEERRDSVPQLYVQIYDHFETTARNRGVADGSLKPFKDNGSITLRFESAAEDAVEDVIILEGKRQSCVDVSHDVIPSLKGKVAALWGDIPPENLIVRCCGKSILIPKDAAPAGLPTTPEV